MTDPERFAAIVAHLKNHRRETLRILARLEVIEEMLSRSVPPEKLGVWAAEMDRLTQEALQRYLTKLEDQDPGFAADLDDRKPRDLDLL